MFKNGLGRTSATCIKLQPTVFGLGGSITDKLKLGNEKIVIFSFYCFSFSWDWLWGVLVAVGGEESKRTRAGVKGPYIRKI